MALEEVCSKRYDRAEIHGDLGNFLSKHRSNHHSTDRLKESAVEKESGWERFTLVSVSVSAQDGIVAVGKAHTRSAPSLSSLPKVVLETVPIFV